MVVADIEKGRIAGFVAMSSGQIQRGWLSKSQQRNKPDPIPIVLLGQLAVDYEYQGLGIGRALLHHAMDTALRIAAEIGCFGMLTHPLDDTIRGYYRIYGFMDLPGDPKHGMILRLSEIVKNYP